LSSRDFRWESAIDGAWEWRHSNGDGGLPHPTQPQYNCAHTCGAARDFSCAFMISVENSNLTDFRCENGGGGTRELHRWNCNVESPHPSTGHDSCIDTASACGGFASGNSTFRDFRAGDTGGGKRECHHSIRADGLPYPPDAHYARAHARDAARDFSSEREISAENSNSRVFRCDPIGSGAREWRHSNRDGRLPHPTRGHGACDNFACG
jgi:hypothetical protein